MTLAACTTAQPPAPQHPHGAGSTAAPMPMFDVRDIRDDVEKSGGNQMAAGTEHRMLGDSAMVPSLPNRFATRVAAVVGDDGRGKTLEIITAFVRVGPDSRGTNPFPRPGPYGVGEALLGELMLKGMNWLRYGDYMYVQVSGSFDGIGFLGYAGGNFKSKREAVIEDLVEKALSAAADDLRGKLAKAGRPL